MRPRSPYPPLLAASALACALLAFRVARVHNLAYAFLAYNLCLAWIPLGLAALTRRLARPRPLLALAAGLAWWLFFPNAFYLVTDLVHFRVHPIVPYWYDIALLASFAWCGTLLALASLSPIHALIRDLYGPIVGWTFVLFTCVSSGYGIWLGRVLRFNSWDAALHPLSLVQVSAQAPRDPHAWGVTLTFGALFAVVYLSVATLNGVERTSPQDITR